MKKLIFTVILIFGGLIILLAQNTNSSKIITKLKDYQLKEGKFIIETIDNQRYFATLTHPDEDNIERFLSQLASFKLKKNKIFIQYTNDKILSIQAVACQPLEFLKEDDKLIYMAYGIAPGILRIDKNNDILYNQYLKLADTIKANSIAKNKKYIEYAATNEGIIEYMGELYKDTD